MSREWLAVLLSIACYVANGHTAFAEQPAQPRQPDARLRPAFPEYVTGDECLFCHRELGTSWADNSHQLTLRRAMPNAPALVELRSQANTNQLATQVDFLLGKDRVVRFLQRSEHYGKLKIHSTIFRHAAHQSQPGKIADETKPPSWDESKFADRCAGCHATAVDAKTGAFSATSIDCFVCHGSVDLQHSKDSQLVLLSSQNREPRQVVSICGQCHLRGGKSNSTGRPYPNTFVAGDDLFSDFRVDFSDLAVSKLSPADRHLFENVRDVQLLDKTAATCLSCHSVHKQSTASHQSLDWTQQCKTCHGSDATELNAAFRASQNSSHNDVCEY